MKKEFNPILRILALTRNDMIATSGELSPTGDSPIKNEGMVSAPARGATPTTVNGVLGQVADQK